jgi:hypothetical protein
MINKDMSTSNNKFDAIYENILWSLREDVGESGYIGSDFEDNIALLVKLLKDNDYVKGDIETITAQLMHQHNPIKELNLDMKDGAIPPIKLKIKGGEKPADSQEDEDFSVTVIPLNKPEQQKEFTNTMLETIFADVINFIKAEALQSIAPEAGVETLPPSTGANAQPAGETTPAPETGESALPGV